MRKGKKGCEKALKAVQASDLKDAADISLFGRMVASDHSLTVEAAAMFSHALSTHKVDNEIDFFSAVDDLQPRKNPGRE
jgi:CRISPR system Cascade subunit CasC